MKNHSQQKNFGFTLVETLVAVTILVIGALGPLAIAAQGISSAGYAKDQITAYYLAQEGVELVRSVRDTNAINGHTDSNPISANYWLQGVDSCVITVSAVNGCIINIDSSNDPFTIIASQCSSGGCTQLKIDGNGYYNYQLGGTVSAFTRTIKIKPSTVNDNNEKIVEVRLNWSSRGVARSFILTEYIYNYN